MTENMPAGLLPQIGEGLGVSEAMAGQTVTLYLSLLIVPMCWPAQSTLVEAGSGAKPGQ